MSLHLQVELGTVKFNHVNCVSVNINPGAVCLPWMCRDGMVVCFSGGLDARTLCVCTIWQLWDDTLWHQCPVCRWLWLQYGCWNRSRLIRWQIVGVRNLPSLLGKLNAHTYMLVWLVEVKMYACKMLYSIYMIFNKITSIICIRMNS